MKRALTLDGGGVWALLQALALGRIYGDDAPGHRILGEFDLVAANSGGAIVLACLLANRTPAEIAGDFQNLGFRKKMFVDRGLLSGVFFPRWSTEKKLQGLADVFGKFAGPQAGAPPVAGWSLGSVVAELSAWSPGIFAAKSPPALCIAAFNINSARAEFFRSPVTATDPKAAARLIEAVHASSTAPVQYFDDVARTDLSGSLPNWQFWDGAMAGYNNPALAAVVEALRYGWALDDLRVLALGTGSVVPPVIAPVAARGKQNSPFTRRSPDLDGTFSLERLKFAGTCIVDDPPDSASYIAHQILRAATGRDHLVRLSPLVQARRDDLQQLTYPRSGPAPNPTADRALYERLCDIDMDAVEPDKVADLVQLGRQWLAGEYTNQPINAQADGRAVLGETHFVDAWRRWRDISLSGLAPGATPATGTRPL